MAHLPSLISDLALILLIASVITLLFKWLKQPVVLGYIVAGMLAGHNIGLMPTVVDTDNIQIWAEIGVMFLLFTLGLEFSFKKLTEVGKSGLLIVMVELCGMLTFGFLIGRILGWKPLDSLLLGGMISLSSTTIIIKAFNDLKLKKRKFSTMVFATLVVEDLVAVVMMVLISTLAVSKNFSGEDMLFALLKLVFFLIIWFMLGIFLIPTFLKKLRPLLNDETLLIVSLGLCLGMVVLAVKVGFSAALGAFIMGSILAETFEVERIEKLTKPLKDFFGAIFFVSVGMMVDMNVIVQFIWPIVIISLVTMLGKLVFVSAGVFISGQSLKTSMQSGFSMAQIGEFAFILAGLGMSLGVTGSHLHPIVIAVSVITVFCAPYMMKLSGPAYLFVLKGMPERWKILLNKREQKKTQTKQPGDWFLLLKSYFLYLIELSVLILGVLIVSDKYLAPFLEARIPQGIWADILVLLIALLVISPFLRALTHNRSKYSGLMLNLWTAKASNRIYLILLTAIRMILAYSAILYLMFRYLPLPTVLIIPIGVVLLVFILRSKMLMKRYWRLEARFMINLNERQMEENLRKIEANQGVRNIRDMHEAHWLDNLLYTFCLRIEDGSLLIGKALKELNFREEFNLIVIRVERNKIKNNVPDGNFVLEKGDILRMAGHNLVYTLIRDEELKLNFVPDSLMTLNAFSHQETQLKSPRLSCSGIPIRKESPLAGKKLVDSGLMSVNKCLVIGMEREKKRIINPDSDQEILPCDLVWVIGEEKQVSILISENVYHL
ncbi:MAG: cation:proton antiporter [Bacteroidales bacterium]|nr:cation:proton antiporter [Bacteroidales bacterium]MDD4361694.1 cation:proton antiporter [Bacteroidales bacterium]